MSVGQAEPRLVNGHALDLDSLGLIGLIEYVWCIQDFKALFTDNPSIVKRESPIFIDDPNNPNFWKLHFHAYSGDYPSGVALQLVQSESTEELKIHRKMDIVTLNGSEYSPQNRSYLGFTESFTPGKIGEFTQLISATRILNSTDRLGHSYTLSGGNILRIHCEVMIIKQRKLTTMKERFFSTEAGIVSRKCKSFLDTGSFSDVTLKTSTGSSFPVCKVILASHSPVFETMFGTDMKESKENVVIITDFSDDAIKGMLEYMYTGGSLMLAEHAIEMLEISEKYQISNLKRMCEMVITQDLTVENAIEVLLLANVYSRHGLMPKVISFIRRFKDEVMATESFDDLKTTDLNLPVELLVLLATN